MAEAPGAPCTHYMHPELVGWGYRVDPPQNLPSLDDHLSAKFHPNLSSNLDFTPTHTHIALYVLED